MLPADNPCALAEDTIVQIPRPQEGITDIFPFGQNPGEADEWVGSWSERREGCDLCTHGRSKALEEAINDLLCRVADDGLSQLHQLA